MPNDLTVADVQQLIRQELSNAVADVRQQQPLVSTNDNQTQVDYRAVCDFMSGEIFDFVIRSDDPQVREFGRNLALKLADKFQITTRLQF